VPKNSPNAPRSHPSTRMPEPLGRKRKLSTLKAPPNIGFTESVRGSQVYTHGNLGNQEWESQVGGIHDVSARF